MKAKKTICFRPIRESTSLNAASQPPGLPRSEPSTNRRARFERMSSVQAKTATLRAFHFVEYRSQMGAFVPETTPLPGCLFQGNPHRRMLRRAERLVQTSHDLRDARFFTRAKVRAGV